MRLHRKRVDRKIGSMPFHPTSLRHARPVQPRVFPASDPEWHLPESKRHALMCAQLYELLSRLAGPSHSVGSDQFVYYDGASPKKCVAPDAFLKIGVPDSVFDSWKTWESGTPELCVEVLSPSDTPEYLTVSQKTQRYRSLGVRELVVFNFDAKTGKRLRVFDRLRGALLERVVARETTPCIVLSELLGERVDWVLAPANELSIALRAKIEARVVPTMAERLKDLETQLALR